MSINSGILTTSLGSIIGWDDSQNSGKHYTYDYSFITKHLNKDQPNEEMHRMRSGKVPKAKLLSPQDISSSWYVVVYHQLGNSAKLQMSRILLEFHYVGIIGWSGQTGWTQSPAPLSSPRSGSQVYIMWFQAPTLSNHTVGHSSMTGLHAKTTESSRESSCEHKLRYGPRHPLWVPKTPILRKFPAPGTKVSQMQLNSIGIT